MFDLSPLTPTPHKDYTYQCLQETNRSTLDWQTCIAHLQLTLTNKKKEKKSNVSLYLQFIPVMNDIVQNYFIHIHTQKVDIKNQSNKFSKNKTHTLKKLGCIYVHTSLVSSWDLHVIQWITLIHSLFTRFSFHHLLIHSFFLHFSSSPIHATSTHTAGINDKNISYNCVDIHSTLDQPLKCTQFDRSIKLKKRKKRHVYHEHW
jgi:hypothetical protein